MPGVCENCKAELERPDAAIFTEWLHGFVECHPDCERFPAPFDKADHSPCGCTPRRVGTDAFDDGTVRGWANGQGVRLETDEPFVLLRDGNWVRHVRCGKSVGHVGHLVRRP